MFEEIINTFYGLSQNNLLATLPVYPADYKGTISAVPFFKVSDCNWKSK